MDFGQLLAGPDAQAPTEPRELYESLPDKAKGYGYLRDVQGQVLADWHERRTERDLVVKVNTGGGKTIDGLVILQSLLNEGLGPALYVAPGKQLVKQVLAEAERIGIRAIENPESQEYLTSEAIAVVNAYKLVNGKTVFSTKRPSKPAVPIGSVVIDDAHAALVTVREKLSIKLGRDHKAFRPLLDLFRGDLEHSSPTALLEINDQTYSALAPVPFWSWRSKCDAVRAELHKHRDTEELLYVWPAVKDVLPLCRAVFTGTELTITPPCPPIRHITEFVEAKRRIYLTATLADDSVLVETFGADAESIKKPIAPKTAGDIGERMILAPQGINPGIIVEDARSEIAKLAKQHNVVVLTPSNRAAQEWAQYGATVVTEGTDQVDQVVDELRTGPVGRLVALSNRYDGIDLPDDACRVLVLDGLPEARSADDRLEAQLQRHAGTDDRQVQRVEQGMGRGVRSNEDHCVVFLLGTRLSQLVVDPRSSKRFSPATRAQLELSRQVAGAMPGKKLQDVMQTAGQALERDPQWTLLAKRALAAIRPEVGSVSPVSIARRRAFEAAVDGNFRMAADFIEQVEGDVDSARSKGWLQEQRATYLDHVDPAAAQRLLADAKGLNSEVLRPMSGIEYRRLSFHHSQAQRAATYLSGRYANAEALRLGVQAVIDDLVFVKDRAEEFEEAFMQLGVHLGLSAERPEKTRGEGPDVLWGLSATDFWVVEAKNGSNTQHIHKLDANQLAGSMNWFRERYGELAKGTPVMVHKAHQLHDDASATEGMMMLDERGLARLTGAATNMAAGLASGRWDDAAAVASQLEGHKLRADDLASYLQDVIPAR